MAANVQTPRHRHLRQVVLLLPLLLLSRTVEHTSWAFTAASSGIGAACSSCSDVYSNHQQCHLAALARCVLKPTLDSQRLRQTRARAADPEKDTVYLDFPKPTGVGSGIALIAAAVFAYWLIFVAPLVVPPIFEAALMKALGIPQQP
eukprot:TRINITY_DN6732_c1_g1_i1.p1 TRINITY_DN6732_c1_g1~~TRINITY_DN6732_c1_g1_i1.p1  ORF type:complete len:147 (+),score=30.52 TRINITY_DN6732_c1_g1_i1:195-635(+)